MDARSDKRRLSEQTSASTAETRPNKKHLISTGVPHHVLGLAPNNHNNLTAQSDFRGQGIQNSGSGNFSVGGDVNIVQAGSDKDASCLRDLRTTDPRDDKSRIEQTKGGLLEDSYRWILDNADFRRWRDDGHSRLLWIKGDPGKGKTMLLCGIINELEGDTTHHLSYFFCQATDTRLNSATAVLRGLIYLLVDQQRSLISYIREKYDHAGKQLFEDANAWWAMSKVLAALLNDSSLDNAILIIDALDECGTGLPPLLDLISQSSFSSRAKWIVSSRNWPVIEETLDNTTRKVRLCLELNEDSISNAVRTFIRHKVDRLSQQKGYDNETRNAVQHHLLSNANDTFLWVALVCHELANPKVRKWHTLAKLRTFPPGLNSLYERMVKQIFDSDSMDLCRQVLAVVSVVYRPIALKELTSLVESPADFPDDVKSLEEIIRFCGSFLAIRKGTVYFVHQSAKDFLLREASNEIFPSGMEEVHYTIFSRSLDAMSETLRRDIYGLCTPGFPIDQVKEPQPNPLSAAYYSCVYWADHLADCLNEPNCIQHHKSSLCDNGIVHVFLQEHLLHWLEAMSLLKRMPQVGEIMRVLQSKVKPSENAQLSALVHDATKFVLSNGSLIGAAPLQTYCSALIFSPQTSLVRKQFWGSIPKWIKRPPIVPEGPTALLQTLEGHSSTVQAVAFSPDGKLVASGSYDRTVRLWDSATGESLQTLKGHTNPVRAVVFLADSKRMASVSNDDHGGIAIKLWDSATGASLQTLEVHLNQASAVAFSPDGKLMASGSFKTIRLWDSATGGLLQTLKGHSSSVSAVGFSPDGKLVASASYNEKTVWIWDLAAGTSLQTLECHLDDIHATVFSPDGKLVASTSSDKTVRLWDSATGELLQTLKGHPGLVSAVAFSPDGKLVASGSYGRIWLWDSATGTLLQTLKHNRWHLINAVVISPDGKLVASGSENTVRLWDSVRPCDSITGTLLQKPEGHSGLVQALAFSPDGKLVASASVDKKIRLWDSATGTSLQTLEGHSRMVNAVAFSPNSTLVASGSDDGAVMLWDPATGVLLQTLMGHSHSINAVTFSPDNKMVASVSNNEGSVSLWDSTTGTLLQTLRDHSGEVSTVEFSPDGKLLVSRSYGDIVAMFWDSDTGMSLQALEGHSYLAHVVALSPDGKFVAFGSYDDTVMLCNSATGTLLQELKGNGHLFSIRSVVFSPDSKLVAAGAFEKVTLWDVATGRLLQTLTGYSDGVDAVAFSPNNTLVASGSHDKTVRLWDPATGILLQTLEGHSGSVETVAFSPDGRLIVSAAAYGDNIVRVWDSATGALLQTLEHSNTADTVAFSPDSKLVVSASYDKTVRLWDSATGILLQTLEGHSGSVGTVAFSPDGRLIVSAAAYKDNIVRVWDSATGVLLQTLEGHSDPICAVAFSPDGKLVVSASRDKTVKLWDPVKGTLLQTLEDHLDRVYSMVFLANNKLVVIGVHNKTVRLWSSVTGALLQTFNDRPDPVSAMAFSPDGKLVASASYSDKMVMLWDSAAGTLLQTLKGHLRQVLAVAFSPDGKLVASASHDKRVKLWGTAMGELLQTFEVDAGIYDLSFSEEAPYLEIGDWWNIQSLYIGAFPLQPEPLRKIFLKRQQDTGEQWVTQGMEKLLWLPPNYRASCWAFQNNILALGHESGHIMFMEFSPF